MLRLGRTHFLQKEFKVPLCLQPVPPTHPPPASSSIAPVLPSKSKTLLWGDNRQLRGGCKDAALSGPRDAEWEIDSGMLCGLGTR